MNAEKFCQLFLCHWWKDGDRLDNWEAIEFMCHGAALMTDDAETAWDLILLREIAHEHRFF